jgi:predicted anti-sigma-YlaC factor YlaD
MAGDPYLQPIGPGPCDRAREWSSLRLDGELSELEEALLDKHLESCAVCAAFDLGLQTTAEIVRTTPAARPRAPFEIPAPSRERIRLARVLAVAGVLVAAALGSIVGSTLDGPAPGSPKPAAQVSFLTKDLSQLRQIPRGRRLAPQFPAHQPGGPPEGVI